MAFRRKRLILICLLAGITGIFVFLTWDSLNQVDTAMLPQAQHNLEINNSSKDGVVSKSNSATNSLHEAPDMTIPESLTNALSDRNLVATPSRLERRDIAAAEIPYAKKTVRPHAFSPILGVGSPSVMALMPNPPHPTVIMKPSSEGENSIDTSAPMQSVIPEQWTEPELEKITAIVGFPQTKTYRLRETFVVTLAVNKGVDSSISAAATDALDIKGSTTRIAHPLLTPSRYMKATLMYANKKVESGEPEVQPVSLKDATIWTWEITPDLPGRHYMKILLSAYRPNNQPDFSKPFIYQLTVTEDLWSHIKRILATWITPQWISADWLWKTILLPVGVFILWQLRVRWRAYRRKKKLTQQDEKNLT